MSRRVPFRYGEAALVLCLALGLTQGCARSDAFRRTKEASSPGTQKLPFHPSADHGSDDSVRPAVPVDHNLGDNAPFRASLRYGLPAGTLLTVRLENSFSLAHLRSGDAFKALLATAVSVEGGAFIDAGTEVSGRVESTQTPFTQPGQAPKAALVRLTLSSITIDGKPLRIQTSSLFAKANPQLGTPAQSSEGPPVLRDYGLQKGRQLTFRLSSPVTFVDLNSLAQYSPR